MVISGRKVKYGWSIAAKGFAFKPGDKKCDLCTTEKCKIIFDYDKDTLNKRSEIVSKCRHMTKYFLSNFASNEEQKSPKPAKRKKLKPFVTPLNIRRSPRILLTPLNIQTRLNTSPKVMLTRLKQYQGARLPSSTAKTSLQKRVSIKNRKYLGTEWTK